MAKKDFRVSMTVTTIHDFVVTDCNTAEEAESIAEGWFAEGEEGLVNTQDIDNIDTIEMDGSEE